MTVNVSPAIVTVSVLAGPILSGIEMNTLPLPLPLDPETIVMNVDVVAAVQAQPLFVVTVIVRSALVLLMVTDSGEIAYVQVVGVRKVSVGEYTLVEMPSVARACQYQSTSGPRSRLTVQLVVCTPCGMLSAVKVRTGSFGNVLWSDTSKR